MSRFGDVIMASIAAQPALDQELFNASFLFRCSVVWKVSYAQHSDQTRGRKTTQAVQKMHSAFTSSKGNSANEEAL